MRFAPAVALSIALVLSARGSARADDPPAAAGDVVVIDILKEMRVADLLNVAAKHIGRPILWQPDDKAITGKKYWSSEGATLRVPKDRVLSVLRSLLVPQEVVLIPIPVGDGPAYFAMDARALASQYLLKVRPQRVEITDENVDALSREEGLWVTATIAVSNFDTLRDASTALRRLTTQNNMGSVQEIPDARTFLVTDMAPNVAEIWRAIRAMDAAAAKRRPRVEIIRLHNARAEKVVGVLQQLTAAPERPQGAPPVPDATRPRIAADSAANTLVLVASPDDLDMLRGVIAQLDEPERSR